MSFVCVFLSKSERMVYLCMEINKNENENRRDIINDLQFMQG